VCVLREPTTLRDVPGSCSATARTPSTRAPAMRLALCPTWWIRRRRTPAR
jgi:hypothetical protein